MARTEALPSDAWRAGPSRESLPFAEVQSPQQVAAWHSPSAQNWMVPVGDLALLRHCEATGDYGQVRSAWVGSLFEATHRLIIEMPPACYLALGHLSGSCVIALPCVLQPLSEVNLKVVKVVEEVARPVLLPITDLDTIQAYSYRFVSYMSLWTMAPSFSRATLKPAIYMQLVHGPTHPLDIACRCACWAMSRTEIARFVALRKVEIPSGASLFDTMYIATQKILGLSDADVLAIVGLRIVAERNSMHFGEELLEMDAAIEVIDCKDREEVQQERKSAGNKKPEFETLSKAFKEKRQEVQAAAKPAKRPTTTALKSDARGGASSSSSRPAVIPKTITHAEAIQYLPPGCAVWRSNTRNEWWGHCKPFKRVVVPWMLGEESSAMFLVLRKLWVQHLELTGQGPESCPYQGLL